MLCECERVWEWKRGIKHSCLILRSTSNNQNNKCHTIYLSLISSPISPPLPSLLPFFSFFLSQCGDQSLWQRTRAAFFEKKRQSHPFLLILHAIIKNEMMDLVAASDLSKWKETLALLSTYGKNEVRTS